MVELNLKPVEYFGHSITINPNVKWLTVDADGVLFGYLEEPYLKPLAINEGEVIGWRWAAKDDLNRLLICVVDLQGKDWRETKVKV